MANGIGKARLIAASVAVLLVSAYAPGCGPTEDPSLTRARAVIVELCAQNPEYERYFLSIARGSDAPEARARVLEALGDDNLQTALVAVEALGDAPPAESLEPLRQVFGAKGGALKRQAAIQLARLGDAAALEHLRNLTADPVQSLSIPAVVVISRSEAAEAFLSPLLRQRMASEDAAVRGRGLCRPRRDRTGLVDARARRGSPR